MKGEINPVCSNLTHFVNNLPIAFDKEGEIIYEGRNELRRIQENGQDLVVKSFKVPHIINRIAYVFFRPSKAKRSYEYGLRLLEKGINTPFPVAYIENYKRGLIYDSYYVSFFIGYPGIMRELRYSLLSEKRDLVSAFARFTAFVHNQNVLHIDYSPGNILYEVVDGKYNFCLLDINRMKFCPVDMDAGCYNLRKLWGSKKIIAFLAKEYALERGFNEEKCVALTLKYHSEFWKRFTKKHPEKAFVELE